MRAVKRGRVGVLDSMTDRTFSSSVKLEGRALLESGSEISVRGQRGRFRFVNHTVTVGGAEWVTCWGPVTGDGQRAQWRSFDISRIKSVHRVAKARPTR